MKEREKESERESEKKEFNRIMKEFLKGCFLNDVCWMMFDV